MTIYLRRSRLPGDEITTFEQVHFGGGGQLTGLDIAPDGAKICRTDTAGIWLSYGNEPWYQGFTSTSMPSDFTQINVGGGTAVSGGWEVAFAPSNSDIVYAMNAFAAGGPSIAGSFAGNLFKSTDRGLTWTWLSAFSAVTGADFGTNGIFKFWRQKLAVDPVNPDHIIVGTIQQGIYRSTDGGASFNQVSAITDTAITITAMSWSGGVVTVTCANTSALQNGQSVTIQGSNNTNYNGVKVVTTHSSTQFTFARASDPGTATASLGTVTAIGPHSGICFDASSGTTGGKTSVIYVPVYGGGVWRSTDGGANWSDITGSGPKTVKSGKMDARGTYYCTDQGGGHVWAYNTPSAPNAWSDLIATSDAVICTDPNVNGRVIISSRGVGAKVVNVSFDYGATWTGTFGPVVPSNNLATDVPWMAIADLTFMSTAELIIDPTVPVVTLTGNISNSSNTITNLSTTTGLVVGQFIEHAAGHTPGSAAKIPAQAKIATINTGASSLTFDGTAATGSVTGANLICNTPNVYQAEGIGMWKTSIPDTVNRSFLWEEQTKAIEQLVANDVAAASNGNVIFGVWDRQLFVSTDFTTYGSTYGTGVVEFGNVWAIDVASNDPNAIAVMGSNFATKQSAISSDGGSTWTRFASVGSSNNNGCIAFSSYTNSTTANIVMVPNPGATPVYTTDAGQTWTNTDLPTGIYVSTSSICSHTICADRVASGVFYSHSGTNNTTGGVYRSTNGGANWTQMKQSPVGANPAFNMLLRSTPAYLTGDATGDLWYTDGGVGGSQPVFNGFFWRSTDGGATWGKVNTTNGYAHDVLEVISFGFGKPRPGGNGYPAIYIVGWVDGAYGAWRSDDTAQTWTYLGYWPNNSLDGVKIVNGDPNIYGRVYIGGSGFGFVAGSISS